MTKATTTQCLMTVLLLLGLTSSVLAQVPPRPPQGNQRTDRMLGDDVAEVLRGGRVLLNYENLDVRVLARLMAELTGRNIVLDDRVQGRVTVLSSREVTPEEAWDIFRVALERYGFSVYDRNGFTQIIPSKDARNLGNVIVDPRTGAEGNVTMGVLIFKNADVNQVQNAIRNLLSEVGVVQAYPPGKAIIVADRAPIVARVAALGPQLDRVHPEEHVSVVYPTYAEATELVDVLNQLLNRPGIQPQDRVQIQAFEAGNAVVTYGTAKQIRDVKTLIDRLDLPTAAKEEIEEPKFYVIRLKNGKAEDIAKILSEMLAERAQAQQQILQEQAAAERVRDAGQAQAAAAGRSDAAVPDVARPYPTSSEPGAPQESRVFVSAKVASDPDTNSLVLYVSPSEYQEITQLVAFLDAPRKQILVTAVVAEVSLRKLLELGAAFQLVTDGGVLSTFNAGLTEEGLLSFLASGRFILGTVGGGSRTINVGGRDVEVPEFFASISAEQSNTDFNLISAPRILTEDHKEAEMEVGDVVPFATGARFDQFGQPLITYDYRDVGIKLRVIPHVSQSDTIRLELEQEVQEVTDFLEQNLGGFGYVVPLISNRSVNTTVTVKDGQTLMIGGLISKRTVETLRKIPILGDIPLINFLFREKRTEEEKTTLFISLTPHVVERPDELARLDRPYEEFLEGDRAPSDHQSEEHETRKPEGFISPYHQAPQGEAPPVKLEPAAIPRNASGGVQLSGFRFASVTEVGQPSQPVVTVSNGAEAPAELVLIATVKMPDGSLRELRSDAFLLTAGQAREVPLPTYTFSKAGTHVFDVTVWEGEELVGRLPLPQKVNLK